MALNMNLATVDFKKIIGTIKAMHAVNNVPRVPYDDNKNNLFIKMQEAGIPYSRLHDTGGRYGGARYVDIANIFPDFDNDVENPASYDFAFTDRLLEEIVKYGMKPFFRLGETIENFHFIKTYNIYPPKDFQKWARICEMIIRHYNEGWANGYKYDIEYWEIWNEPDNATTIEENPMWKGTPQQFYEFYSVVSKHIKKCFNNIKVGGYGSCGFYAVSDADFSEVARSTSRVEYFIEFLNDFLDYSKAHESVLDFFSWHSYANIKDNVLYAEYARKKFDGYGYKNIEIFLNEWNPGVEQKGFLKDASNILSGMCLMQNTSTDMCMYYDASIVSELCGMFDFVTHDVYKAYYAFYGFNKLYVLKNQVECSVGIDEVYSCGATDGKKGGLLVVNNSLKDVTIKITAIGANTQNVICYALDEVNDFTKIPITVDKVDIPKSSFRYFEFIIENGEI